MCSLSALYFISIYMVFYAVPLFLLPSPWPWIILSFVLFRIFDTWKPSMIGHFDSSEGSLGVMMDDIIAGTFSALIIFCLLFLLYLLRY